jgi:acyl-CoA dehydrogenase
VQGFLAAHKDDTAMKPYAAPLNTALGHLQQATMWFVSNAMAKPDNAGAGATDFMHLFGLVALGYMWARMVKAANEKIAAGGGDVARYKAKLITARFFVERLLPETGAYLARIQAGADSTMAMPAEAF